MVLTMTFRLAAPLLCTLALISAAPEAGSGVTAVSGDDRDAVWAPDAARLAVLHGSSESGRWRLRVVDRKGRHVKDLGLAVPQAPAWSRDGRRLAYVRNAPNGRDWQLVVATVASAKLHPLALPGWRSVHAPVWSPRANSIALLAHAADSLQETLLIVSADGRVVRALLRMSTSAARAPPVWSPDGRKILMAIGTVRVSIYAIDIRSGSRRRLVTNGSDPKLSPNGRLLAYPQHDGFALHVANADGTHARRLAAEGFAPSWAPDSRRLAFLVLSASGQTLYVIETAVGKRRRLTNLTGCLEDVAWAPKGETIAFTRTAQCESHYTGPAHIWLVNADGSGLHRLLR
jgi:Tol biopolymer transport system component